MKTVRVNLGKRSYNILIGAGLLDQSHEIFGSYGIHKRLFLISNARVFELFGQSLLQKLSENDYQVTEILIPEGEKHKNLQTVENIYTYLISERADRSSTLAALGGGVTGDIAGFVAATFLRGIPYIQIPTTLVSQVDSSVGGKTGVNHHLGKNMIGAFCQPRLVSIDTNTLSTLPQREFQSGLYEVVKYGLICDLEFFEYLETHLESIKKGTSGILEDVISRCCELKAEIISHDETEQNLRRILNFGHTFGHALEAATEFQGLTHGEAVAYGMLAATRLSFMKGYLDSSTRERIIRCICRVGDLPSIDYVPTEGILEAMKRDKKRQGHQVVFVLLKGIGKTIFAGEIEERALAQAWEEAKLEVRS
ncbi:3-dehydroquinate synthase [Acidobacteria bacterium AH-259-G07]|nr:3-dehydroquinate synthase [Acidobacteria bacterium AH-259-G07]